MPAFARVDVLVEHIKIEDVLAGHGHIRLQLAAPVAVGEDLPGGIAACVCCGAQGIIISTGQDIRRCQ